MTRNLPWILSRMPVVFATLSVLWACGTPASSSPAEDAFAEDAVDVAADVTPDTAKYVGKCAQGPQICDDGNPCTVDDCDPATGCVTTLVPCADQDPCTLDACDVATGQCTHVANTCDDGNACTTGTCDPVTGCAFAAVDCSDGDACTSDGCSPQAGCLHAPLDCEDHLTCTADSCDKQKGCVHQQTGTGKCCEDNSDCDDNNVCTVESCVAGLCQSAGVYGCCKDNAGCDDKNACTIDTCDIGSGVCSNVAGPGAGCCQSDADCADSSACTLDRCVHNACSHEPTCCAKAADCGPVTAIDACADATCTSAGCGILAAPVGACCTPVVKTTGFEVADAWSVALVPAASGQWTVEQGQKDVKTGQGALVFRDVAPPIPGAGAVASVKLAPIALPPGTGVTLTFQVQSQLGSNEVARLAVVTDAGEWFVWQQSTKTTGWTQVTVKLDGFAARVGTDVVRLRWDVTPAKSGASTVGWLAIDDVSVSSTCQKTACTKDSDCNDNLAATADACGDGVCVYTSADNYCETSATCDDGDVCTADSCLPTKFQCLHGNVYNCCHDPSECQDQNVCTTDACNSAHQCTHSTQSPTVCCNTVEDCDDANVCTLDTCPVVGLPCAHTQPDANCCMTAKDCNDAEKCTIDTCAQHQCGHQDVCCTTDADCNDQDDVCTTDACIAQFCQHTPTGAAGCCVATVFTDDFENGVPAGWVATTSSTTIHWQTSSLQAHSGTSALWWGDAAKGNYDDGAQNFGTLTSLPLTLPAANAIDLSFWVWVQTESGTYDNLTLSVTAQGKTIQVWQKADDPGVAAGMGTWVPVKVNLSAFAGNAVTLVFKFDSGDSIANTTPGIFVDDLLLHNACTAATCADVSACNDGLAATADGCAAGQCTWAY